jgi:ubiquinone biosynthesis O-methyltransferase
MADKVLKTQIRRFFNKMAIDRNDKIKSKPVVEYEQRVRSKKVISLLDPKPGDVILDVGCGNARDLIPIAQKGCRCIGIDLSDRMIKEARASLKQEGVKNVKLDTGDATNLNFSNDMFDKVLASEVLEHIPNYRKCIAEMIRVLKPKGSLIITTPNREGWYGFDRYVIYEVIQRRRWRENHPFDEWKTYNELKSAICDYGLKIEICEGICYLPGFFVPYKLPRIAQKILVKFVNIVEPLFSKILPTNGYMVAIKAVKKSNS